MTEPTIVFDLDGTLMNTAGDLLKSLDHCLSRSGFMPADAQSLSRYVGMGGRFMIERALRDQSVEISSDRLDDLLADFLRHYEANIPGQSLPYPGAVEAIFALRAAGFRTAICTNKFESLSRQLLQAVGIDQHFDAICGADTFHHRKPDPRHLTETVALAGGTPASALMVGDSETDIKTARAASIPVIAVDFGYSDQPVATLEPDKVISDYSELTVDLVNDLLERAKNPAIR